LNEDKNQESLFATLSQGEESNLPELSTIDIYSLPLSTNSSSSNQDDVGEEAGRRLFNGLRLFDSFGKDEKGVDLILVECVEEKGVGFAVMERARKAAGGIEKGNEMEFAL
jgi:L-threonylcarbamoyladenylate synthase